MKCPQCQVINPNNTIYCMNCGLQLLIQQLPPQIHYLQQPKKGITTPALIALILLGSCGLCSVFSYIVNDPKNNAGTAIPPTYKSSSTPQSTATPTEAEMKIARFNYTKILEQNMLEKNFDVYASVEGKKFETLKIKYILMSRPTVYQLSKDSTFINNLKEMGFKKVIFTDGYNDTWTLTL